MTIRVQNNVNFKDHGSIDFERVLVGFFEEDAYPDGTPVSLVAAVNEFGSSDGRVPERPFLRNAADDMARDLAKELSRDFASDEFNLRAHVGRAVGEFGEQKVQQSITNLVDPPNAPSTIAGKGSANPLVDTGKMRDSVRHRVVR